MELEKVNDFKPAIFEGKEVKLTYAQELIYNLLVNKAKCGETITKSDIDLIFSEYISKPTKRGQEIWIRCWIGKDFKGKWVSINEASTMSIVTYRSLPWFKHNLASCILKGKLIALPIIEI